MAMEISTVHIQWSSLEGGGGPEMATFTHCMVSVEDRRILCTSRSYLCMDKVSRWSCIYMYVSVARLFLLYLFSPKMPIFPYVTIIKCKVYIWSCMYMYVSVARFVFCWP